jgi:DNA-binding LacI/PurR family transcriptional regulator
VNCVTVDHEGVGRLAAERLASAGHRRVAYLAAGDAFPHQRQVLAGFRAARRRLRLDGDERLLTVINRWPAAAPKSPLDWLGQLDPPPTALFAPDWGTPVLLQPAMAQSESRAIREMSVLACGFEESGIDAKRFTRIQMPFGEVGRQSALLLQQLVLDPTPVPRGVKVSPFVIEPSPATVCAIRSASLSGKPPQRRPMARIANPSQRPMVHVD